MRIALLSDVHGNLEALRAVLAEVKRLAVDKIYSIGDAVGYGPEPQACLEILQQEAEVLLMGNHDAAVVGLTSVADFNDNARWAVEWTKTMLSQDFLDLLSRLPYVFRGEDLLLVHASPFQPQAWHYIQGLVEAELNFVHFNEKICFVGHTHNPFIVARGVETGVMVCDPPDEELDSSRRYLVNVGSVGQPRDHDPKAAFAVLDTVRKRVEIRRVAYPVEKTQRLMREYGMPYFLTERLSLGV